MPLKNLNDNSLYQEILLDFFRKVYEGEIQPDHQFPPERKQAEELSVSRGTVRKARQLLEEAGYISNTQGRGAVYTPLKGRAPGKMEIIAVVVPVHNPFFMAYYRAFEREAEKCGILVVIKQLDLENAAGLKHVLFSLFLKGIRDIVFWPYDIQLEDRYIERLSGLGMNFLFFDAVRNDRFCDYVSVDNRDALNRLYQALKTRGAERIAYLGWDNQILSSNREREKCFRNLMSSKDIILRLPWNQETIPSESLSDLVPLPACIREDKIGGFLCGNGHIGILLKKYLRENGFDRIPVATVDNYPASGDLDITVYEQPFQKMGEFSFRRLKDRSESPEQWISKTTFLKGTLIER